MKKTICSKKKSSYFKTKKMKDYRESILNGMIFADAYISDFTETVLYTETIDSKEMAKLLHMKMRTRLAVPSIYATIKILERLVDIASIHADSVNGESKSVLPKTKTHVDHTVKKIFKNWNRKVDAYINRNSDFNEIEWNPWLKIIEILKYITEYNGKAFFGI